MKGITGKWKYVIALVAVLGLASCTTTPVNDGDTSGSTGGTGGGTSGGGTSGGDTSTGGGDTSGGGGSTGGGADNAMGGYVVQLIASSSAPKAESIKNTFASEGYKAYVSERNVNGQILYRVQIGPYGSQADAQRVLSQMQRRYRKNQYVRSAVVKTVNGK